MSRYCTESDLIQAFRRQYWAKGMKSVGVRAIKGELNLVVYANGELDPDWAWLEEFEGVQVVVEPSPE